MSRDGRDDEFMIKVVHEAPVFAVAKVSQGNPIHLFGGRGWGVTGWSVGR